MPAWHLKGQYMETCNCAYICPCIATNLMGAPTEGECKAALALKVDEGQKDGVRLDGLKLVVVMRSPGPMVEGNLKIGLIIDADADDAQAEALTAIVGGSAGGPMEALAPLVGEMAGIERRAISFEGEGLKYTVKVGDLIDQTCEGMPSQVAEGEPVYIDNAFHPVGSRLALATATDSHIHAFGIDWDDASGTRNGHFAPFSWAA